MKIINKSCVLCLESHTETECPELNVSIRVREDMVKSDCFAKEQKRNAFKRKGINSRKALERNGIKKEVPSASIFNVFQNINLGIHHITKER